MSKNIILELKNKSACCGKATEYRLIDEWPVWGWGLVCKGCGRHTSVMFKDAKVVSATPKNGVTSRPRVYLKGPSSVLKGLAQALEEAVEVKP